MIYFFAPPTHRTATRGLPGESYHVAGLSSETTANGRWSAVQSGECPSDGDTFLGKRGFGEIPARIEMARKRDTSHRQRYSRNVPVKILPY